MTSRSRRLLTSCRRKCASGCARRCAAGRQGRCAQPVPDDRPPGGRSWLAHRRGVRGDFAPRIRRTSASEKGSRPGYRCAGAVTRRDANPGPKPIMVSRDLAQQREILGETPAPPLFYFRDEHETPPEEASQSQRLHPRAFARALLRRTAATGGRQCAAGHLALPRRLTQERLGFRLRAQRTNARRTNRRCTRVAACPRGIMSHSQHATDLDAPGRSVLAFHSGIR